MTDETTNVAETTEEATATEAAAETEAKTAEQKSNGAATETTEATEQQASDWREQISDAKLRKQADRYASITDVLKSNVDLVSERDRLKNTALVVPGEDADEATVAAFREKLGVPESPDGYEFPDPPEGEEVTEFEKASQQQWAQRFHEANIPKDAAAKIVEDWREDIAKAAESVAEADKQFAQTTEQVLKKEWGEDYDRNKGIAAGAGKELFGEDWADMRQAQTSEGRLLLDHPAMLRMLARVGREMQEGSMGAMTDEARSSIEEQANEARQKRNEALQRGDRDQARKWDERERELLGKAHGNQAIVGAQGRAV